MSHTSPITDPGKRPRKKRAPNARDQEIFVAYRTQGVTQARLAEDNGLSQRRISEIVSRVERWRADVNPRQENELDHEQQQRLDRYLERQRNQILWDRGIRGHDNAKPTLKTRKKGQRDGKKFSEVTIREVAPSAQFLRIAAHANRELSRLSDKPPPKSAE